MTTNIDIRNATKSIAAPVGHPDAGPGHLRRDAGPLALYGVEFGTVYRARGAGRRCYTLAPAGALGLTGVNGAEEVQFGLWMLIAGEESMKWFSREELESGILTIVTEFIPQL